MKRRDFLGLSTAAMAGALGTSPFMIQNCFAANNIAEISKKLNPNTKWLRDAKWGIFSHFPPRLTGQQASDSITEKMWNKKVNSFQVSKLANQLEKLKAPYFFITVGNSDNYFCSPNCAFGKQFGAGNGVLSERDLVAELAEELIPRGIKLCVSLPALGGVGSAQTQ